MTPAAPWLAALGAAACCVLVLRIALSRDMRHWLDRPNERSLHAHPVPRIGGLALLVAATLALALAASAAGAPAGPSPVLSKVTAPLLTAVLAAALLAAASAVDDRRGLPVWPRLLAHVLAATALVASLPQTSAATPTALAVAVAAILATVWMTNAYNFMDGADGLAGTMTLIGFAAYAWRAPPDHPIAWVAAAVSGAAAGFLVYNRHPARVFMGDAGSIPLGFLAMALGLAGAAEGLWPWWAPLGVFLPFAFDASVTLALRAIRGERVWKPHRQHAYQQWVLGGMRVPSMLAIYTGMMLAGALAFATSAYVSVRVSIAVWAVIIALNGGVQVLARRRAARAPAARPSRPSRSA